MINTPATIELLDTLQRKSFGYFVHEINAANGLVRDRTDVGAPSSIAVTGFALASYPVGVEHDLISRDDAIQRTLTCLRFFWNSRQGPERHATGHNGFYYHFLDMQTGRRAWKSELSSVDTAFLIAGMLTAAEYFTRDTPDESEIRKLAHDLYLRVDWEWMLNGGSALSHGWKPECGFIKYCWQGYNEALLLYILALGSPMRPIPESSYAAWTSTYRWRKLYGTELLYSGPLFTHQLSHIWIDFREIQDRFMREKQSNYFENSRRATHLHREYAIRNPMQFDGYGDSCWGLSATEGPGWAVCNIDGVQRRFYNYVARGVPFGPDDGTIAPSAAVASIPFAPEIVIPAIEQFERLRLMESHPYGYNASFNQTFPSHDGERSGWISSGHCGINKGPIVLMIENYRSEMIWSLMKDCGHLLTGLRRAGFEGGWLNGAVPAE